MAISRRDFIRYSGAALGTLTVPGWLYSARIGEFRFEDVDRDSIADAALAEAKKLGASYADIRINKYRIESVGTRERQVQFVSKGENAGFGVRVLVNGTWGFAASPDLSASEARRTAAEAVSIAKANSVFNKKKIELAPAAKAVP